MARDFLDTAKQFARRRLPRSARVVVREMYRRVRRDFYPYASWSQTGEDQILRNFFQGQDRGFFVDVGAAHPKYGSNTYLLYRRGWRGINVDAAPGSMAAFRRERPRDINLEVGVAERPGRLPFYIFVDDEGLNTFDQELAKKRSEKHPIDRVVDVSTEPLTSILDRHAPATGIDLLCVDCEGYDDEVLRSNDWTRFRPRVVVFESVDGTKRSPARDLLEECGYALFANTSFNLFFRDRSPELRSAPARSGVV